MSVVCLVIETWTRLESVRNFELKIETLGRQDGGTVPLVCVSCVYGHRDMD